MREKVLIGVLFGVLAGMLLAQSGNLVAQPGQFVTCQQSKTVWRDVSRFGRKKSAAQNMTEKHDEFSRDGWRLVDMETYTENSDLEGFFLSYSRDIACS